MTRRYHSPEFKNQVVRECLETGNASLVARKYELSPNVVSRWVRAQKPNPMKVMSKKALSSSPELIDDPDEAIKAMDQNKQLKKLLGEKELEIEILRDLLKKMKIPLPPR